MKINKVIAFSSLGWIFTIMLMFLKFNFFNLLISSIFFAGFLALIVQENFPYRSVGIVSSFMGTIVINCRISIESYIYNAAVNSYYFTKMLNIIYFIQFFDFLVLSIASLWMLRLYGIIPILSIMMKLDLREKISYDAIKYPFKFWWFAPTTCLIYSLYFLYLSLNY